MVAAVSGATAETVRIVAEADSDESGDTAFLANSPDDLLRLALELDPHEVSRN